MKKLKTISLRISEDEFESIKNKAEEKSMSISQYLRDLSEERDLSKDELGDSEEKFIRKISKGIEEKIVELQKSRRLTPINIFAFFGIGYIFGVISVLLIIILVNNII